MNHQSTRSARVAALSFALLAAAAAPANANAQTTNPASPASSVTSAPTRAAGPDLQGLWDFTMRVGERTSPGFIALGPVEQGFAGSITMYLTNTLAIRPFAVVGDSVHMVVASREGDVVFHGRLTDDARAMEGIVHYHGGARLPMVVTRRAVPVAPR